MKYKVTNTFTGKVTIGSYQELVEKFKGFLGYKFEKLIVSK